MRFSDPRRFFDAREGVRQAFAVPWTAVEFQDMMKQDFANDPFTVVMQGEDREYLCSMEVNSHGEIHHYSGSWEEVPPAMGVRHEYGQSLDALQFMEDYANVVVGESFEEFLLKDEKQMEVPLFPPFEPEYVTADGQAPKISSTILRQDYKKIVDWLEATVPNQWETPEDKIFHAWSLTPSMAEEPRKPVFLGRAEGPTHARRCVWLEFNPLTAAGAAMVVAAEDGDEMIEGFYEWYGTKKPFKYHAHGERANRYVIHPDEWHERIGSVSKNLLAYDLVANYDYWHYTIRERPTQINRAVRHFIRELVLPYTFRIVTPQPMDPPYKVRSLPRRWETGAEVNDLALFLKTLDTKRPGLDHTTLDPGEAYVMYPGSSLAHRVKMRDIVRLSGKYVRIVPDLTNDKDNQFDLIQLVHDKKSMGVFSRSRWPGSPFVIPFEERPALKFKYQSGESNAIEFEIDHKIYYIFRGIFRPTLLPQAYLKAQEKKDAQLPLFGFYVNPDQNSVYVDADIFRQAVGSERCPSFTAVIPHDGTFMNRQDIIVIKGLPVMEYMHAMSMVGEARSLRARLDMAPLYDELSPTVFTTISGDDEDLYAQI